MSGVYGYMPKCRYPYTCLDEYARGKGKVCGYLIGYKYGYPDGGGTGLRAYFLTPALAPPKAMPHASEITLMSMKLFCGLTVPWSYMTHAELGHLSPRYDHEYELSIPYSRTVR